VFELSVSVATGPTGDDGAVKVGRCDLSLRNRVISVS